MDLPTETGKGRAGLCHTVRTYVAADMEIDESEAGDVRHHHISLCHGDHIWKAVDTVKMLRTRITQILRLYVQPT